MLTILLGAVNVPVAPAPVPTIKIATVWVHYETFSCKFSSWPKLEVEFTFYVQGVFFFFTDLNVKLILILKVKVVM